MRSLAKNAIFGEFECLVSHMTFSYYRKTMTFAWMAAVGMPNAPSTPAALKDAVGRLLQPDQVLLDEQMIKNCSGGHTMAELTLEVACALTVWQGQRESIARVLLNF
jgi:hypothetical protein